MPRVSTSKTNSKRRSSRLATQSQSQSQSEVDIPPSWLDPQSQSQQTQIDNSFLSISTASLPPKYSINLALPVDTKLCSNEEKEYRVKGEEFLHDGWRRSDQPEGTLVDLRRKNKRIPSLPGHEVSLLSSNQQKWKEDVDQIFWYNAGMKFPCVCSLTKHNHSYTYIAKPPESSEFHAQDTPDSEDSLIAEDPKNLPEWYDGTDPIDPIDLDPSVDHMKEFKTTWHTAHPPFASQISNSETVYEGSPVNVDLEKEIKQLRKAKFKAIEVKPLLPLFLNGEGDKKDQTRHDNLLPPMITANRDLNEEQSWEEEVKRRKAFWRKMIRDDGGYGKMWDIIPYPYTHPSRYLAPPIKRKKIKIPPYNLPRTYHSLSHPFHPNLPEYIQSEGSRRVYWLIPIHGPIFIPTLNHPLTENLYPGQVVPTKGELVDQILDEAKDKDTNKRIIWTSSLLLSFIQQFLHPLYMDDQRPFGVLGYTFSGAKPDPFLDIPYRSSTNTDDFETRKNLNDNNVGFIDKDKMVKPECGDHLRIYCNLKYSLELRTWLHNVKIPIPSSDDNNHKKRKGEGEEKESKSMRIFYKTRLTLIGDKGEVLMVA
ncbi:hypothetical protein L486_04458 [Kwoniella mangroviensis CBS 10435]|uniref:Uncharacterized protein n=1 Tax=Kwoniella mangroviensis CBS 10435 TaxID=1331196 RepID=A0A1B9ISC6_9TREE|nr:hypothetical protein L486_04458 [Kwoniella mangroviensis CBS 10435]OCF78436.1 hypothetical protein I204_00376 [Kwoniella mangroviensis CBS 8886]